MERPVTVLSTEWKVEYKEWDDREWVFRFQGPEDSATNIANTLWGVHSVRAVRLVRVQQALVREKIRDRDS